MNVSAPRLLSFLYLAFYLSFSLRTYIKNTPLPPLDFENTIRKNGREYAHGRQSTFK